MFLGKKILQDSQSGKKFEMAILKIVADGYKKDVLVPYDRWNFLNDSIRAQAPAKWDLHMLKRVLDASDPIAFLVSQLAYTEAQIYPKMRVPTFWKDLVPVSYEAPPWAETVEYQTYEGVGRGKRIAPNGTDMPLVNVKFGRKQTQVESGGLGYAYNLQELIASQQMKRALPDILMMEAIDGSNRHLNDVALFGEENFSGLFNNASVTPVAATTGNWDKTTTDPKDILADLNKGIDAVYKATGTTDFPSHVLMPIDALSALNNRIMTVTTGDGTTNVPAGGLSVLAYLKANNLAKLIGGIDLEFRGIPGLETSGTLKHGGGSSGRTVSSDGVTVTNGTSRVVYYVKNAQRGVMHVPQPHQFLAPQLERLSIVVPGHYRYAGYEVRYAQSFYFQDAVLQADPQS